MRSVELTLDPVTDAAIRAIWLRLADAGLPSLSSHRGESNRPHVTVAAGEHLEDSAALRIALAPTVPIAFGGVLLFPASKARFVLAAAVVASPRLLETHARAHVSLTGAVELTRPGGWTPHVTLARRMTAEQVAAALPLVGLLPSGRTDGARLWDGGDRSILDLS